MSASVWKWCFGALLLFACAADVSAVGGKSSAHKPIERYATQSGDTIQLHPTEVTFQLPEAWRVSKVLLRPTGRELRKVNKDDFYLWGAPIADAALNLRDCAVQVAPDNLTWVRVYIVDSAEEEILKRIQEKGRAAVYKMPFDASGHSSRGFQTEAVQEGRWQHVDIPYVVSFGDYNAGGFVSFYLRPVAGRELVLVFSYFGTGVRSTAEREDVLKSVVIPEVPTHTDPH